MIFGYIRVSSSSQSVESQKNLISRYCMEKKILVDKWIEVEISSKKSTRQRRVDELIQELNENDIVIASELSRFGRSIREVLGIIESIVEEKKARLIFVKQNLDLNHERKNVTNKILITVFSMVAELERDFISERTKEGLRARKEKGIKLGKPKGTIQASMYDKDKDKIFHLYQLGVAINTIINMHLKYGKYHSLKKYVEKRLNIENI